MRRAVPGVAVALAVTVLAGCGDDPLPEFCTAHTDAQEAFPGKGQRQNELYYSTLVDVAPDELRGDLRALRRMVARPKTFRRVAWDRRSKTVDAWITSNCGD